MVWRKRRRYRLANIISYICYFFGIVFIVGNVIMLRQGFVQLYTTTFGGRGSLSLTAHKISHHKDKWRDLLPEYREFVGLPRIELPASVLSSELRLRKLMEDADLGIKRLIPEESHRIPDPSVIQTPRFGQDTSVIYVSSWDLRLSLDVSSDCPTLQNITDLTMIGSGWTKLVFQAKYRRQNVALKTVDPKGHDIMTCLQQNTNWTRDQCYEQATHKLLKEIVLLRGLHHPHIVQVVAHCVPTVPYNGRYDSLVTMATELGEGIDIIKLLHLSWEDRLRISYDLTKLLFYLAHSPYGSVILNDFRRQQFVLVGGELKLTDLDDMGFREDSCLLDSDCQQYYSSSNTTLRTKCIRSQCLGLNEKKNIFNAGRHFTTFLLPHGAPQSLRPLVNKLVDDFSNATKVARELLQDLSVIVDRYSSGSYLDWENRGPTRYRSFVDSDLPQQYDYSCRLSMERGGCTVSVYDQREAEEYCDTDPVCRGFVLSDTRTWAGRIVAHLKNGIGTVSREPKMTLFIKPSV